MIEAVALAAFGAGLFNGVHCAAMCGGIVGAACGSRCSRRAAASRWRLALGYNAGRITSYVVGGALAGALGEAGLALRAGVHAQQVTMAAAGIVLCAYALLLAGCKPLERALECAGALLWRRVQPWSQRFLPADTPARAYGLGLAWGWLPCAMVYAMLLTALAAGSAAAGALVMLAFGLGTLPNLLLIATFWDRVRGVLASRIARAAVAAAVAGVGIFSLIQAAQHSHASHNAVFSSRALPDFKPGAR